MKIIAPILISIFSTLPVQSFDIEKTISNHPLYLSASAQVEASRIGLEKEYMFYYPFNGNLEVDNYSYFNDPDVNLTLGFSLNYKVFNPDMTKRLANKKILIKTAEKYRESVYQLLKFNVYRLLLNYYSTKSKYTLAKESYESIESYTRKVNKKFSSGGLSKSEISFAESILLKNKALLIESEEAVVTSLNLFYLETGVSSSEDVPEFNLNLDIKLDLDLDKIILDDPQIKQVTLLISNTRSNIKLTSSNTIPDITISSSVNYPLSSPSNWQAGVDITIPMFGIGYDNLTKEEYRFELKSKENQLNQLIKDKKSKIESTKSKIMNLLLKLDLYNRSLELSRASLDGVLIESQTGVRTVFDVIDAQNSLSNIKKYIIESENELNLLKLEYKYLTGEFKSNES